jgi:HEPN domain-containing protein
MPDSMNFVDWLEKAQNDLQAAEIILAYEGVPPTDTVVYHAQQVAEKCLKAFLIARVQRLLPIHDLIPLLEECITLDNSFATLRGHILNLDRFYIESKYPPDPPIVFSIDEARESTAQAQEIYNFVRDKLGIIP